jgi:hypothetical protein
MTLFNEATPISLDALMVEGEQMTAMEVFSMCRLDEYTQSAITTCMRCDMKFFLRYILGITPRGFNKNFLVGKMVHKFFELSLVPLVNGENIAPVLQKAMFKWDKMIEKILEDSDLVGGNDMHALNYARAQSTAMCRAWLTLHGDAFADKYEIVSVEQTVRATEDPKFEHFIYRCAGQMDGVLREKEDKEKWWLIEHKSRSQINALNQFDLMTDFQANFYIALAVFRLAEFLQQYSDIQGTWMGFLFNAIKKPQHRVKKGTNDYEELAGRMYEAMLGDPDGYFFLDRVSVDMDTVIMAMTDARLMIDYINSMVPEKVIRRTTACADYAGCEYKPLCQHGAVAVDLDSIIYNPNINLYQGKAAHEELKEET